MPFLIVRENKDRQSEVWLSLEEDEWNTSESMIIGLGKTKCEALDEAKRELEDRLADIRTMIVTERANHS